MIINPLNSKLNPICHLLALLGAHPILHISRIRVKTVAVAMLHSRAFVRHNLLCARFWVLSAVLLWTGAFQMWCIGIVMCCVVGHWCCNVVLCCRALVL